MSRLISILEIIILLAFAWGLDYWVNLLRREALAEYNFILMMWGITAANLLIAATWVYLAWLILRRNTGSRWVSVGYLLIGLLVTTLVPIQLTVTGILREQLLFEQTRFFRLGIMGMIGFTSRFTLTSAFICVLGGISLLIPKGETRYRTQSKIGLIFRPL